MQGQPVPKIRIQGLSKTYAGRHGPVPALEEVNLTVGVGEFCTIVGPSGCGKTTLLRIIAGLEPPTRGRVEVLPESDNRSDGRGEGQAHHRPSRQETALVFQGNSVFPWLTVEQNVGYGLWARGVDRVQRSQTVRAYIETVGLSRFSQAYPHQLSEGMRQRVAIARAFAADPEVLLLDEPFGSLDEQNRLLLQQELLRIWQDTGKTVLFVTHSIDEAIILADRVLVMGAAPGRIKAELPVRLSRPRQLPAVRSEPEFARLATVIWEQLEAEVLRVRTEELEGWRG